MYPIWARCLMNLNASKKFVDSIRSDCNPSHGVVWAWTFIQKVVQKIVMGKNRAELFIKNFSFRCWFIVRPSSSLKGVIPHLSALGFNEGPEFLGM